MLSGLNLASGPRACLSSITCCNLTIVGQVFSSFPTPCQSRLAIDLYLDADGRERGRVAERHVTDGRTAADILFVIVCPRTRSSSSRCLSQANSEIPRTHLVNKSKKAVNNMVRNGGWVIPHKVAEPTVRRSISRMQIPRHSTLNSHARAAH